MRDFIINGLPRSGKDTFVGLVDSMFDGSVLNLSSIDYFRSFPYMYFGQPHGLKNDDYRACLYYLKKAAKQIDEFPTRHLLQQREGAQIYSKEPVICFFHIREPEEIEVFKRMADFPVETIKIDRDILANAREYEQVETTSYDWIIDNNKDIAHLRSGAITFIQEAIYDRYRKSC